MKTFLFFLPLTAAIIFFSGCSKAKTIPLQVVENFRTDDYMGTWYEIARTPNFFERGLSGVTAQYTKHPDGKISVVNSGIKRNGKKMYISGTARLMDKNSSLGKLEVAFYPPFYAPYLILETDYDSFAVVMGKNPEYLWILSRTPELPETEIDRIFSMLKSRNIPTEKLFFP